MISAKMLLLGIRSSGRLALRITMMVSVVLGRSLLVMLPVLRMIRILVVEDVLHDACPSSRSRGRGNLSGDIVYGSVDATRLPSKSLR